VIFQRPALALLVCALLPGIAAATPVPLTGMPFPAGYARIRNFQTERGFAQLTSRLQANRTAVHSGTMSMAAATAAGGTAITGSKLVPVFAAKFANTGADPYAAANLQAELFDGPWPTGTMTQYYEFSS
jgi:hypothetical protein